MESYDSPEIPDKGGGDTSDIPSLPSEKGTLPMTGSLYKPLSYIPNTESEFLTNPVTTFGRHSICFSFIDVDVCQL